MDFNFEESLVMNHAIPSLNSAKSDLQDASNDARSLLGKLPGSFSQRGVVSDIANKLSSVKAEVDSTKSIVNNKMSTVKSIEGKNSSKASSLASKLSFKEKLMTGAKTASTTKDAKSDAFSMTGAKTSKTSKSALASFGEWLWGGIKNVGSAIASGVKTAVNWVGNAAKTVVSGVKNVGSAVANGVKTVANWAGNAVKNVVNAVKNVGSAVASGVKTVANWAGNAAKNVVNVVKNVGSAVASGVKTAVNWVGNATKTVVNGVKNIGSAVVSGAKTVTNWVGEATKNVVTGVKNVGSTIAKGFKAAGDWIGNAAKNVWEKVKPVVATAAQCVSVVVNWSNRITEFVLDTSAIATTAAVVPFTALYDIGKGLLTGNWDWSATQGMWKGFNDFAAVDLTSKTHDAFYSSSVGKWIDENAAFKSDADVFKASKVVGDTAAQISAGLTEGAAKFVESIVDGVVMVGTGIASIRTGAKDIVKGIATGNWDWSTTQGMWNEVLKFTGTDWTSKLHDAFYSGSYGKYLDENAVFTSESTAFKITKEVGYIAALTAATIVTCGVAGVGASASSAVGAAASSMSGVLGSAAVAGGITFTSSLGQNAQDNYNTVINEKFESQATSATNAYKITEEDRQKMREELKTKYRIFNPTDAEVDNAIRIKKAAEYVDKARKGANVLNEQDLNRIVLKSGAQATVDGAFAAFAAGATKYIGNASSLAKAASKSGQELTGFVGKVGNHQIFAKTVANGAKATRFYVTEAIDAADTGHYDLGDAAMKSAISFGTDSAFTLIGGAKNSIKTKIDAKKTAADLSSSMRSSSGADQAGVFGNNIPKGAQGSEIISSYEAARKDNADTLTNIKQVVKTTESKTREDNAKVVTGQETSDDWLNNFLYGEAA